MIRSLMIFTLILFFSLVSCKKENDKIEFNGIVIDMKENTPMPNVLVKIYLSNLDPDNDQFMIDSTWTNDVGEYEFTIKRRGFKDYHVSAFKDNFMEIPFIIPGRFMGWWAFFFNSTVELSSRP